MEWRGGGTRKKERKKGKRGERERKREEKNENEGKRKWAGKGCWNAAASFKERSISLELLFYLNVGEKNSKIERGRSSRSRSSSYEWINRFLRFPSECVCLKSFDRLITQTHRSSILIQSLIISEKQSNKRQQGSLWRMSVNCGLSTPSDPGNLFSFFLSFFLSFSLSLFLLHFPMRVSFFSFNFLLMNCFMMATFPNGCCSPWPSLTSTAPLNNPDRSPPPRSCQDRLRVLLSSYPLEILAGFAAQNRKTEPLLGMGARGTGWKSALNGGVWWG